MYARALILLLTLVLGTSCTYRDPSIDLLEGEMRWMEDQLFMLEDDLEAKCVELADCRAADQRSAAPTSVSPYYSNQDGDYTIIMGDQPQVEPRVDLPSLDAPRVELPPRDLPTIDIPPEEQEPTPALPRPDDNGSLPEYQIIEPTIELPPEDAQRSDPTPAQSSPLQPNSLTLPLPGEIPELDNPPASSQSPSADGGNEFELQSFHWDEPQSAPRRPADEFDAHVTHIVAQGEITTAYDFDDKSTEPGLLVIVEPRNSDGGYVALAGPLSVVVLDKNKHGSAARIARWDFEAAEARRRIRKSNRGRGIHLVLPWPDNPPESSDLHMFVRYTTVEGRALEADVLLENGRSSQRWNVTRRRGENRWSVTGPSHRVPTKTSPIKTLPVANPADIQLRPIPPSAQSVTTASYETSPHRTVLSTVPIPSPAIASDDDSVALRSLPPVDKAVNNIDMPVIRNVSRPQWKPHR